MNELQIIFFKKQLEQDKRYRVLVTLMRADRPRYWNFLCINCGSKVEELLNYEVVALTDFYDAQDTRNHAVGRHCKGILPNGLPCQYSYYFHLQ